MIIKRTLSITLSIIMIFGCMGITVVSGAESNGFAGGSGTENDPYQVATPEQLNNVRNYMNMDFIQICDIDMTAATSEGGAFWNNGAGWKPIGGAAKAFTGTYDGNNYRIIGLNIYEYNKSTYNYCAALFGNLGINGCIKNVHMREGCYELNSNLSEAGKSLYIGGICGMTTGSTYDSDEFPTIKNCINENKIKITDNSNVKQTIFIGGIVGKVSNNGTVNCINKGDIYCTGYNAHIRMGGIEGSHSVATKCYRSYNTGDLFCKGYANLSIGGVIGSLFSRGVDGISQCYNLGEITILECDAVIDGTQATNNEDVGGIVGFSQEGKIIDCYNIGNIIDEDNGAFEGRNIGGVVGYISYDVGANVEKCYNIGEIEGGDGIGNFSDSGESESFVKYCYSVEDTPIDINREWVYDSQNLSFTEMKTKESFVRFDFETVWDISSDINGGMPYLRNTPVPEEKGVVVDCITENMTEKNISFNVYNGSNKEQSFIVICAIYDDNKNLISCIIEDVKDLNSYCEKGFKFNFDKDWANYKIMLWENIKNISPLVAM